MSRLAQIVTIPALILSAAAAQGGAESTLKDQTDVAVTVYNNNLALVRDQRTVELPSGEGDLKFMDVAEMIQPQTVSLRSISKPGSIQILEQNYEYDLMSPQKMMEKYVGKQVRLVNLNEELKFEEVTAELLSLNDGPIYRIGDNIYLGHPGNVVLPEIPENLIAKPTLVWLLDNAEPKQNIEVSYLTNGISWAADYVIHLARSDDQMDLAGWVTLTNNSGAQYTNASVKLVAGEVNIAPPPAPAAEGLRGDVAMKMAYAMPVEETFAEYHLYTLPRRTTIKQNQSKQVSLLGASGVGVKKVYEYRGNVSYYYQKIMPMKNEKVSVFLVFRNEEKNQLGIPLPAGTMRIYQEDSSGALQFAGEDRIEHTPKDEEVRLRTGSAFDVVAERRQMDYRITGSNIHESTFEIKIRNHKENAITVDVYEPMPNDWMILEKSHDYVKKDAHTAMFSLPVPKDGETVLTYRVQVKQP